jgi:hypothetical protein
VIQCGQALPTDLCCVLTACAVLAKMVVWCDSDMPYDSDMDSDDDDDQSTYTGMSREDISTWLRAAFGSNFSSSRGDELDSICHIVYGHGELQPQEACLQMIHNSMKIFTNSQSLVRSLVRLLWPCGSCGGSGHSADHCPANDSAAAAMLYLEQAEEPSGSASTNATASKKAKQRSKQAAKRADPEKATTATNGGRSMADHQLGEAAATSVAAPDDAAAVVDNADGGTTNASKDTEGPQQKVAAESVPVPAAASVVNSANGGTADAAKDTQQTEQKDSAQRGRSSGTANKMGDADGEQVRCCSDVHRAVQCSAVCYHWGSQIANGKLHLNKHSQLVLTWHACRTSRFRRTARSPHAQAALLPKTPTTTTITTSSSRFSWCPAGKGTAPSTTWAC